MDACVFPQLPNTQEAGLTDKRLMAGLAMLGDLSSKSMPDTCGVTNYARAAEWYCDMGAAMVVEFESRGW